MLLTFSMSCLRKSSTEGSEGGDLLSARAEGPSANTKSQRNCYKQTALHLKNVMFNVSQILALNS